MIVGIGRAKIFQREPNFLMRNFNVIFLVSVFFFFIYTIARSQIFLNGSWTRAQGPYRNFQSGSKTIFDRFGRRKLR